MRSMERYMNTLSKQVKNIQIRNCTRYIQSAQQDLWATFTTAFMPSLQTLAL